MAATSTTRKRKREDDRVLLGDPFIIDAHVSSVFDIPTKVSPAVTLPRSLIPLQWLAGVPSRLFRNGADIPVLNVPGNVLIVKAEGERQMSAVEKLKDGIYMLYRMSPLLKMKDVRKIASVAKRASQTGALALASDSPSHHDALDSDWWSASRVPDYEFSDISRAMALEGLGPTESENTWDARLLLPDQSSTVLTRDPCVQSSISEVLEQVRYQYYETLYISKTSLAYFAKSTLARARVTFAQDADVTGAPVVKLVEFLQQMILPFDKTDLKYQKTLFGLTLGASLDDYSVVQPIEATFIDRWRSLTFGDNALPSSDPSVKREIYDLKIRETKLQVIVLLEILSLQKAAPEEEEPAKINKRGRQRVKQIKGAKSKSTITDPSLLLDLLVDRLCIWRSIGMENLLPEINSPTEKSENSLTAEKDHLRNFCVEVILPFYASKLPERCATINRKFGGPSGGSKHRSNVAKRSRINKDTSNSIATTQAKLSASADGDGERAESVPAFAAADTGPKTSRGGTLNATSFAKRVVQVNAKTELQNAIKALKTPNRAALASEFVEDAEKRLSKTFSKGKTTKARPHSVQVTATPKKRNAATRAIGRTPSRFPIIPSHLDDAVVDTPKKSGSSQVIPESSPFRIMDDRPLGRTPSSLPLFRNHLGDFVIDSPKRSGSSQLVAESSPFKAADDPPGL